MLIDATIVAFAGGILCLDRVIIQAMISRPIVVGPIIGFILRDPYTGLIVGAFIELLWIDRFHIGVDIPPNDSVVAILITGGVIIVGSRLGYLSRELIAVSTLLFVPCAFLGQKIDTWIVRSNDVLSKRALECAKRGDMKGISRNHMLGLLKYFLSTTVFIFVSLICGIQILLMTLPLIPGPVLKAFSSVYFCIPIIGIAVALTTIKLRGAIPVFSGIFLISALFIEIV